MKSTHLLLAALLPFTIVQAQDRNVPLTDANSIAITVNTGTVLLTSHKGTGVVIRGTRVDGSSAAALIAVKREGPKLQFTEQDDGGPTISSVELLLPDNVPVRFAGFAPQLNIKGLSTQLDVLMSRGDTEIEDHNGKLSIDASNGKITLRNITGDVRIKGTSQPVFVDSIVGSLNAETVAGNIDLKRISSPAANATTQQGSIAFEGDVQLAGSYVFTTLNGNISWHVPMNANATVSFGSVLGTVRSSSQLPSPAGLPGAMQSFVLGMGGADVKMMTYKGNVEFVRQ